VKLITYLDAGLQTNKEHTGTTLPPFLVSVAKKEKCSDVKANETYSNHCVVNG
jgi:hypothetical protein